MRISPIATNRASKPKLIAKKTDTAFNKANYAPSNIQNSGMLNINSNFKPSFGVNFSEDDYRRKLQDKCFREAMLYSNQIGAASMITAISAGAYNSTSWAAQNNLYFSALAERICNIYNVPLSIKEQCKIDARTMASGYSSIDKSFSIGIATPLLVAYRIMNSGNMCLIAGYRLARYCEDYVQDNCVAVSVLNPVYDEELVKITPIRMKEAIKTAKEEVKAELKAEKAKTGLRAKAKYQITKQKAAAKIKILEIMEEKTKENPELLTRR